MKNPIYEDSLRFRYPEIAREWDSIKNNDLNPESVTPGSGKKVWWICDKGHEYLTTVVKRTARGQGCPYCSNVKVLSGFNDLTTTHHELLSFWDYEKNNNENLKPESVLAGTDKKAWWICEQGHSYQMRIANKTRGAGCPVCTGQIVTLDNCLANTDPELANEWHPSKNGNLTPYDVMRGSHKKAWWMCELGHEWQAPPYSRLVHGCPVCDSEKRTSFPEQAILYYFSKEHTAQGRVKVSGFEVDVFIPDIKLAIEYDGLYYHQGKASEERENKKNDALKQAGVFLIRVKETKDKQYTTDNIIFCRYSQNYEFIEFVCKEICRIILAKLKIRINLDVNINRDRNSIHEQYIQTKKENSLAARKPLAATKWDYSKNGQITPEMVSAASKKKFWWKCPRCGYEWEGTIGNIPNREECPNCVHAITMIHPVSGNGKSNGYSLLTEYPQIASEWDSDKNGDLSPSSVTPGSNRRVWWKCAKCGHEWFASIKTRTSFKSHCPKCAIGNQVKRRIQNRGSFGDLHPDLVCQWDEKKNLETTPYEIAEKSKDVFWWTCNKGHSYEMSAAVKSRGTSCPICIGKRVHETNCLATKEPEIANWWDYEKNGELLPTQVMPGSAREVWWRCPECSRSFMRRLDVMRRIRKCKYCKKSIG